MISGGQKVREWPPLHGLHDNAFATSAFGVTCSADLVCSNNQIVFSCILAGFDALLAFEKRLEYVSPAKVANRNLGFGIASKTGVVGVPLGHENLIQVGQKSANCICCSADCLFCLRIVLTSVDKVREFNNRAVQKKFGPVNFRPADTG